MWARYLIIYLYAVSDADYGDDNMVSNDSHGGT